MSKSGEVKVAEFSLPSKAKPSEALGRDFTRPQLCDAYVKPAGDGEATLYATDSYKLVALTVQATGEVEPQFVPAEALKAAEKTGRFQIGEYVEPLSKAGMTNGVLFRKSEHEKKPPNYETILARDEPKRKFEVGFNAEFLHQLADAMGTDSVKVTFDLDKPLGSILVQPLNSGATNGDTRALLMPIRLNVP